MSYNEYAVEVLVRNNRIYLFNTKINPYIEISLRLIKENDSEENLYGASGFVNFNNYRYSFREPFFSNFSLDNLLKNPSIVLNRFFGNSNYLLTGLKDKLRFSLSNKNQENISNIVIKYFKKNIKNIKNIENNNDYIAVYTDTIYSCCATCVNNPETWIVSQSEVSCSECSRALQARCTDLGSSGDINGFECVNGGYNNLYVK